MVPSDAEVVSHRLMLRSGMLKKLAAGIYTYQPFGWRSMSKMMSIVRREMDRAGVLEPVDAGGPARRAVARVGSVG